MDQWRSLVVEIAGENPDLEPSIRNVLNLLIEVNEEITVRGKPYPETLAYLVALCQQADDTLLPSVDADPPWASGDYSVDALLRAFTAQDVRNWHELGRTAVGWMRHEQGR